VNVLSLDTATEVLSLAAVHGESWASLAFRKGLQHSPALLPLVDTILGGLGMKVADVELLVCSLGPGSFTGIRIGLATAMGISHGRRIPIVGVSTLDALASPWCGHRGDVFPVIDARKGKIYAARFRAGARQGEYMDISPAELARLVGDSESPLLAGPDAERIRDLLGDQGKPARAATTVDPRSLLDIGVERFTRDGADPSALRPLYLRKSEAEIAIGL
jgi:tRNA threonylcarbamoyladenosine biosynthesis protein TsaB